MWSDHRWGTFLLGSLSAILTTLLFQTFFYFNHSICSTIFSLYLKIPIMYLSQFHWLSFKLKGNAPFNHTTFGYFADCDGFYDHLKGLFTEGHQPKFSNWVHVGIDAYIPFCNQSGQACSSSMVFSFFSGIIAYRN